MNEIKPEELPSILQRAWRIRLRMIVEKVSGIPAENKQVFLSRCLIYEAWLGNESITKAGEFLWGKNGPPDEWMKWDHLSENEAWRRSGQDWGDWEDWHKLNALLPLEVSVQYSS